MDEKYRFQFGQIVLHKRYGYRGVIFDCDDRCEASQEWYMKNQTQPPRDAPWYHVLVHGATHTTYVAESNLALDESGARIAHPWLDRFFQSFLKGRYYAEPTN